MAMTKHWLTTESSHEGASRQKVVLRALQEIRRTAGQKQASIRELLTALAKDIDREQTIFSGVELTSLRAITNGCPACILTAIRNSPQPVWADFTFADEMAAWLEIHGTQRGDK